MYSGKACGWSSDGHSGLKAINLRRLTPKVLDSAKILGILDIFDTFNKFLIYIHYSIMMFYIITYIFINSFI